MVNPSRDEYRRLHVDKEKVVTPENEIRVVARHSLSPYIAYAIGILTGEEGKTQNDTITISGMGGAIHTAVNVAEIVKHRVVGLHQITEISSEEVTDMFEPIEKESEKENLTVNRRVSTMRITLSLKPLDTKNPGYQPPIPAEEVQEQEKHREPRRRGPRENGTHTDEDGEHTEEHTSASRGRGGRGGRGGRRFRGPRRGRAGVAASGNE